MNAATTLKRRCCSKSNCNDDATAAAATTVTAKVATAKVATTVTVTATAADDGDGGGKSNMKLPGTVTAAMYISCQQQRRKVGWLFYFARMPAWTRHCRHWPCGRIANTINRQQQQARSTS